MNQRETENTTRIFIVDDHAVVVQGLKVFLEAEPDLCVCGSAANVEDASRAIARLQPDLVIVDLSLEKSSGLDLLRALKIQHPDLPAIVLSMHDECSNAEHAFHAGARGYVMKDKSLDEIVVAIRAVLSGKTFVSDQFKQHMLDQLVQSPTPDLHSIPNRLSEREMEVFAMIGQGYRPRHIADKLFMSVATVGTHCKRIRQKLNLVNMQAMIELAREWLKTQKI
ncbi:MAG: DNA-binding response regulator [Candidatus Omnitrophota bacterium]|jgi:DNA-binding NarL/FixJ family response regulator|nr:MAG: DNA-binding response regulator [Candidatus Omnitrophota bacterium]